MRDLYTRSPDTPAPPRSLHKSPLQDLHKASMRDLFTGALYKVSSQDHHAWHLYTRSPEIPGPPRSLHRSSVQDFFTGSLPKISMGDLYYRSSFQDLLARPLSAKALMKRFSSLLQDLFTRFLWKISLQELSTRSLHKTSMRDLYTVSPDILGPPRSPHRSSLQDLFTSLTETTLYRICWYRWTSCVSIGTPGPNRSSLQDLFTRPLWEISKKRALYKISSQDPYETSLYKIPWYPWTS